MTSQVRDDPVRSATAVLAQSWLVRQYLMPAVRPATVLTFGLVVAALTPVSLVTHGPSLCPFKILTGLPCPGCGMTRSVVTLLHGDVGASTYYHPLGVILVAICLGLVAFDAWSWWRESRQDWAGPTPAALVTRIMLTPAPWVAVALLTVVWLVRLPLYVAGIWVF